MILVSDKPPFPRLWQRPPDQNGSCASPLQVRGPMRRRHCPGRRSGHARPAPWPHEMLVRRSSRMGWSGDEPLTDGHRGAHMPHRSSRYRHCHSPAGLPFGQPERNGLQGLPEPRLPLLQPMQIETVDRAVRNGARPLDLACPVSRSKQRRRSCHSVRPVGSRSRRRAFVTSFSPLRHPGH